MLPIVSLVQQSLAWRTIEKNMKAAKGAKDRSRNIEENRYVRLIDNLIEK